MKKEYQKPNAEMINFESGEIMGPLDNEEGAGSLPSDWE